MSDQPSLLVLRVWLDAPTGVVHFGSGGPFNLLSTMRCHRPIGNMTSLGLCNGLKAARGLAMSNQTRTICASCDISVYGTAPTTYLAVDALEDVEQEDKLVHFLRAPAFTSAYCGLTARATNPPAVGRYLAEFADLAAALTAANAL